MLVSFLTVLMATATTGFALISANETQLIYSAVLTFLFCFAAAISLLSNLRPKPAVIVNKNFRPNQFSTRDALEFEAIHIQQMLRPQIADAKPERPMRTGGGSILSEVNSFLDQNSSL